MYFSKQLIPFFVVDRPISLKILEYCEIDKQSNYFGLMGHANTTKNFQTAFKKFPTHNIVKMVDSGVFTKEGCKLKYKDLFSTYNTMNADFGIIIDILKDKEKTLKSAQKAINHYQKKNYNFKLVGVAQGNNIKEYMECYAELMEMGYDYVAIGGLLKKTENTVRYVRVKDEKLLENVLKEITNYKKEKYPHKWIFALGCYHPKRHNLLNKYHVFGADYKGWILNYKTPTQIIAKLHKSLENIENKQICDNELLILITKRGNLQKELKENKTDKNITNRKINIIDKEILQKRVELTPKINNDDYAFNVKSLDTFMKMNKIKKRQNRFNQVRSYLYRNVYSFFKKDALIISCSAKKNSNTNPLPAMELYDGPYYRTLRKLNDEKKLQKIHIMIISAKYGLLNPYDPIEDYNLKMTDEIAQKLNKKLKKDLNQFLKERNFNEIYISMGKDYQKAINGLEFDNVQFAEGKIGQKISKTKKWINSKN